MFGIWKRINAWWMGYDFIMLVITALIVAGVVILAKKKVNRSADNIVMDALKMKLVKGEITEEEYIKRKTILE